MEIRKGLGLDFADEIETSFHQITEHPKRWSLRKDGTRRYLAHRFPFIVIYAHEHEQVWVIAIAHCKRQPGYWNDRRSTATDR